MAGTSVKHKIADVPDEVCLDCAQEWDGECRAFQLAHSREELDQRLGPPEAYLPPKPLCLTKQITQRLRLAREGS